MGTQLGAMFDPEAIEVMRSALDEAVLKLPVELRSTAVKVEMASCIVKAASNGDRNLPRLRTAALLTAISHRVRSAQQTRRAKSA